MLALVPLTMIANQISLKTVKTSVILTSIPFFFLLVVMAYGFVTWLHRDYRNRSNEEIEAESRRLGEEGAPDGIDVPVADLAGAVRT
ncbi:hypothetical protein D9M73_213820 [compost metagenome]